MRRVSWVWDEEIARRAGYRSQVAPSGRPSRTPALTAVPGAPASPPATPWTWASTKARIGVEKLVMTTGRGMARAHGAPDYPTVGVRHEIGPEEIRVER